MPTLNDLRKLHTEQALVDPAVIRPLLDYLQQVEDRLEALERRTAGRARPERPEEGPSAGSQRATQGP